MKFTLGKDCAILMHTKFDASKGFCIGNNSVINSNCRIDTRGGVFIGNNVSISSDVIILTADHDMDSPNFEGRTQSVTIEDYVWIGTRVTIMPGIKVMRGAVIGSGSIVTKSILPFNVVAGVPAKIIKKRTQNLEYELNYRRLFQ
jgi:maltose O-acetyltransferase